MSPKNRSRVRKPPLFRWLPVKGALYYNLQLYRSGRKVLSVWPSQNRYALARSWIYRKHRYRLTRGLYTWFVWPGMGPRADGRYGKLLGSSTFVVASP